MGKLFLITFVHSTCKYSNTIRMYKMLLFSSSDVYLHQLPSLEDFQYDVSYTIRLPQC